MIGGILGRLGSAAAGSAERTGAGRAYGAISSLATKEGRADAFAGTTVGRLVGGAQDIIFGKEKSSAQNADATSVARGGASGLSISKQTLSVLQSIDQNLERMVEALGLQKQKEEAAAEEAASEAQTPGAGAQPAGGEADSKTGKFKWVKIIGGLVLAISQIAMPLYETIKSAVQWLIDMGMKVFDFLSEKFMKLFTEDIPQFFVETVPDFFMNTLPEVFFSGVDFLKGKMDSILKSVNDILGNLKKNIGDMIVNLADSSAAKLLLPEGIRTSIKDFGQKLQKSEAESEKKAASPEEQAKAIALEKEKANKAYQAEASAKEKADAEKESAGVAVEIPGAAPGMEKAMSATAKAAAESAAGGVGGAAGAYGGGAGGVGGAAASGGGAMGGIGGAASGGGGGLGGIGSPADATPGAAGGVGGGTAEAVGAYGGMSGDGSTGAGMPGGVGGGEAAALGQAGGTGNAVAMASMAATAPDFELPPEAVSAGQVAKNMNKPKANADPVNPIANVPDVFPSLGTIADLWYHNASALTA